MNGSAMPNPRIVEVEYVASGYKLEVTHDKFPSRTEWHLDGIVDLLKEEHDKGKIQNDHSLGHGFPALRYGGRDINKPSGIFTMYEDAAQVAIGIFKDLGYEVVNKGVYK